MIIAETAVFTRQVGRLLSEDAYRSLQLTLMDSPRAGRVIRGTGGLRKIRWRTAGHGSRGGIRAIYYYSEVRSTILMLSIYRKTAQTKLTPRQRRMLGQIVRREFG